MRVSLRLRCNLFYTAIVILCFDGANFVRSDDKNETVRKDSHQIDVDSVQLYRRLLKQKREEQLEAVAKIQGIENYEKQYKLVEMMLQKLFTVIATNQIKLMESGFIPGDAFPTEENLRDAFSMIAENTAFLGDILLKLPDITHKIMKKNPEWGLVMKWCIGFMNESSVYEARENKLLNLMAQELEIVPRDPNYVNPFREEARLDKLADQLLREAEKEQKKKEEKKKKKKKKGPRLSGGRSEL